MTKQVTPCGESAIMLAVRKSSLFQANRKSLKISTKFTFANFIPKHHIPLQCLLAEKVSLSQRPYKRIGRIGVRIRLAQRYAHRTLRDNKERIAACALPHNIIALLVERLLQHIADLDQRILGQFLEDRHTAQKVAILGLPYQARSHHNRLEALSFDGPQFAIGCRCYCGGTLAIVQDGQFAEHLGAGQCGQVATLTRDLDTALWTWGINVVWRLVWRR